MTRKLGIETLECRHVLATLVVTSVEDTIASDGLVTLREAVIAANLDTIADEMEGTQRGDGDDTIQFDPSLAGEAFALNASLREITISSNLTIEGLGPEETTLQGGPYRFFVIDDEIDARLQVELKGMTLRESRGTAIVSEEDLTLRQMKIVDNMLSEVVTSRGNLSIINSIVESNGRTNFSKIILQQGPHFESIDSEFRFNVGAAIGLIHHESASIVRSTVSGNTGGCLLYTSPSPRDS